MSYINCMTCGNSVHYRSDVQRGYSILICNSCHSNGNGKNYVKNTYGLTENTKYTQL